MTSKRSYFKLWLMTIKNHMWSIALTCIGLFVAMPIMSALSISIINNSYANGLFKKEVLAGVFSRNNLGEGNYFLMITTVILAIIIAMNGFSYLFSREKVDLYHSIPVKRERLFIVNYLAGLAIFLVPYLVFMFVMLGIGQAYGFVTIYGLKSCFIMLVINMLGFVAMYSVTVLAILLTGNVMVSLLATGVFLEYEVIIRMIILVCNKTFFVTYSETYGNGFFYKTVTPLVNYFELLDGMDTFNGIYNLNIVNFVFYILFIMALIAINLFVYMNRPSEAAGKSIAFKMTMPVISIALLIPAAIAGGMAFEGMARNDGAINYTWLIFGSVFVLIIMHLVIQAIYFRDFKSLFKNLLNPLIAGVIVSLVFAVYIFDLTGYDNYNPSMSEKLESTAISSYALQSYMEYYDFDKSEDEYGNRDYWKDMNGYRLENVKITDRELVNDFIEAAVKDSVRYDELSHMNVEGYDPFEGTRYSCFTVQFNMSNGKKVYREYNLDVMAHMDLMDKLIKNPEYKKGVYEILSVDEDDIKNIKFASAVGVVECKLTREGEQELIKAYKEDLMEQGAYSIRDETALGYIFEDYSYKQNQDIFNFYLYKSYVYPSFTRTLAVLEKYGVDIHQYDNAENIDHITVTNYNTDDPYLLKDMAYDESYPYEYEEVAQEDIRLDTEELIEDGQNGSDGDVDLYDMAESSGTIDFESKDSNEGLGFDGNRKVYTSKEEVATIYEKLVPTEFFEGDAPFKNASSLDVQICFTNMPSRYNYEISYLFIEGEVPDFVERDVKLN